MALTAYISDFITKGGLIVQGTGTVSSSTSQTGAVQINSGAAINKNLIVGSTADIYGDAVLHSSLSVTGTSVLDQTLNVGGIATFNDAVTATSTLYVGNDTTLNGKLSVAQDTLILGALTVTQATILSSTLGVTSTATLTGDLNANGAVNTFNGTVFVTGSNILTVGTGATTLGGTLDVTGIVTLTNATTAATGAGGSGALKLTGGAYVGDNLLVMSTDANTATSTSNALYVAGGAWIDRSLVVNQDAIFKGNAIFQGTATYVYSTQSVYTDNLIELHVPPNGPGTAWALDDGKDIGIRFNYFNVADKNAAIVFSHSSQQFEFFKDGAEGDTTFSSGVYSDIKAANATFVGTGTASTTATGAVQVVGGIGLGGDLFAGGDVSGNRLAARNLTLASIPIVGDNGVLIEDLALTFDLANHTLNATITTATTATMALSATTATNLAGGDRGFLPYQSAPGVTTFVSTATVSDGYVLTFQSGLPVWEAASGTVDAANNISGGAANEIPFQISTGTTGFSTDFEYNDATKELTVGNVTLIGSGSDLGTHMADNTLAAISGDSISVYSNLSASLNYNNTNFLIVDSAGGHIVTAGGSFAVASNGNATLSDGGILSAETIHATSATNSTSTTTGALVVTGGAAIGKDLWVGGDINVDGTIYMQGVGMDSVSSTTGTFVNVNVTGTGVALNVTDSVEIGGNVNITGRTTATTIVATTQVKVTSITNSTATNNGSITTLGGVGVAQDVVVGGAITVGSVTSSTVVPALYSNNVLLASYTKSGISGNSTVNLDAFAYADYRTARYTIQIVDGTDIHVTEMSLFHNDSDVWINEYGTHYTTGALGVFDAIIIGSDVVLKFVPAGATAMTIKVVRFGITA